MNKFRGYLKFSVLKNILKIVIFFVFKVLEDILFFFLKEIFFLLWENYGKFRF